MNRVLLAAASLVVMGVCQDASGQFSEQSRLTGFGGGRFTYGYSERGSILNSPSISPYLALTDFTGSGVVDPSRSYFTQVRPRLENEARQQRQQRTISNLQRNVSAINSGLARANSQQYARSTGHPTRFVTYLQYYPGLSR